MKIAVFLNNNEITALHEEKVLVVVFKLEEEKVVGVENSVLEKQTNDAIVNWLYRKSISQIYLSDIDAQTHHKITSKGIQVKTLENLENDKLFNSLALSTFQLKETS